MHEIFFALQKFLLASGYRWDPTRYEKTSTVMRLCCIERGIVDMDDVLRVIECFFFPTGNDLISMADSDQICMTWAKSSESDAQQRKIRLFNIEKWHFCTKTRLLRSGY